MEMSRVWVDADEFEELIQNGRRCLESGESLMGAERFTEAVNLYRGDFLEDEHYADWAVPERERLRGLATEALRLLAQLARARADLESAAAHLERLAGLHPFDSGAQREMMEMCIARGRRSEAMRRYEALRARMLRQFGERPDFELSDLSG